MCFKNLVSQKPKVELLSVSAAQVFRELEEERIKLLSRIKLLYPCLLDDGLPYYFTTSKVWAEIFIWIYFKQKMPAYQASRMDCDDFAIWLKGLVGANFGLNYFGVAFGMSPAGYHSWNIFRSENGLLQLEPQTGEFFDLTKDYKPDSILI